MNILHEQTPDCIEPNIILKLQICFQTNTAAIISEFARKQYYSRKPTDQ